MERIDRNKLYLEISMLIAQRGSCKRLQVGCVITQENRIITTGYNGPPAGQKHCNDKVCNKDKPCERAIHSEANAISYAAKKGIRLEGATLYCTNQPCLKCAELIIQSGIKDVIYIFPYRLNEGLVLLQQANIGIYQIDI